jgi:hypothetical protein
MKEVIILPVPRSHSLRVFPDEPDTAVLPSGLIATVVTLPLWPSKIRNRGPPGGVNGPLDIRFLAACRRIVKFEVQR